MIHLTEVQQSLHDEAVEVCNRRSRDEALLIEILQKIDRTKLYKKFERSEDQVQLTTILSREDFENLNRSEALAAQKGKKFSGRGEVVGLSLTEYVERHDPVKKAARALKKKLKAGLAVKKTIETNLGKNGAQQLWINRVSESKRVKIRAEEKHPVFARDSGRCTHINMKGERCTSDRYLHIHHIIPVSLGGSNNPNNLTTLCSAHHDLVHLLSLPIENQVTWLRSPLVEYLC